MEKDLVRELPYEEDEESFGKWFRTEAGDKWKNYLGGEEKNISIRDRDAMREFLVRHGTREEIQEKLDSLHPNMQAVEALVEEIEAGRPDVRRKLKTRLIR